MKKYRSQNKRLDEIGRKLLETGRIQADELERIVSAPHLFSKIQARIDSGQKQATAKTLPSRPVFSFLSSLSGYNAGAAFAALLIGVLTLGAFYLYARQTVSPAIANNTGINKIEHKDVRSLPADTAISDPGMEEESTVKRAAAVYRPVNKNRPALKVNLKKRTQPQDAEYESDGAFYPLTYTGNPDEITAGAQVVRVELPRSSLFSMGVDLPDENRAGTVKADLLISADGVTRGFRLVR